MHTKKITAIVPTYNEGERIHRVLETLCSMSCLHEVIVVDDGSTDSTEKILQKFPVTTLRHEKNRGKAAALQTGIEHTDAELLFFCDGDIHGFQEEMLRDMLAEVQEKNLDMFIALRPQQVRRIGVFGARHSGERILRRSLWEKVPSYYKDRFRIEAGLNNFAQYHGRGYGNRKYEYFGTLKQDKFDTWGSTLKYGLKEIWEVASAHLHFQVKDLPKSVKELRWYSLRFVLSALAIGASIPPLLAATTFGAIHWKFLLQFTAQSLFIFGLSCLAFGAVTSVVSLWKLLKLIKAQYVH